jgi:ABC-type transport system involved in multi-copper enzyme maturation permease subunit
MAATSDLPATTSNRSAVGEVTSTALTMAALTLREAVRKRVVWALLGLSVLLLALSAWGFAKLPGMDSSLGQLTSTESRLIASQLLNLVMFGLSMVVALGTAFLAGPTLGGEIESGVSLAMFARPVRRGAVLLGKWLGLVVFGSVYVGVVGLCQFVVVRVTVSYWPPQPLVALALLALQTTVLLTLALLLSSLISPLASGITTVGLFGAAWVAGVVGGVGQALDNRSVEQIGVVSQVLLPTDGLWRGAMHATQDPTALATFGRAAEAFPFLSRGAPSSLYLGWALVWIGLMWTLCAVSLQRRDL